MTREILGLYSFNRGIVSRIALGRTDLKRVALAAQVQDNYLPRVLGCMSLRPGLGYIGAMRGNNAARVLRFIFATNDTALVELTDSNARIWINDTLLTRPSVSTAVTNGTFSGNINGWNDNSEAGGAITYSAPYLEIYGNGTAHGIADQQVTVAAADQGVVHALRIVVARGPVQFRVGSAQTYDDYVTDTVLQTGTNSISFTPTGNFWIRFYTPQINVVYISQCTIEASGAVTLPTPWLAADLPKIRYDQSGDVIFVACRGYQQRRIVRRGTRPGATGWSIELYAPPDGPFQIENTGPTTIASSGLTGNVTLTASDPIFKSTEVGSLMSITSVGQTVTSSIAADNTFTDPIRVTGAGIDRTFSIDVSGTFVATVTLQRSYTSSAGPWLDVSSFSWTAPVATTCADGLDNQILWYRIGVKAGNYTSGTASVRLSISSGSIRGIVRLTAYTNKTTVSAEIVTALGGKSATTTWQKADWSDEQGWPSAVRFYDGRLWWAGYNGIWGSVSDAYDSFDETVIGDSGPINRTIGSGPVDTINWILPLQRMLLGAQGSEISVRSNTLDDPITPTNMHFKTGSTQGSCAVEAVQVDHEGYFVNRSTMRVYELAFDVRTYDYLANDITALCPELGSPGIVRMDVQRQPDTRIHCVRSDGVVMVGILDRSEDTLCWVTVTTDGFVEDVVILPASSGNLDDQVYYVVKRTINGSTVRYLEKMAQEIDCRGGSFSYLADAYLAVTNTSPTATITGLGHLEGQQVVVWADGADVGTDDSVTPWVQKYTVSGGQITLAAPATNVVVGLPYTAQFQSAKLGLATAQVATTLNQQKVIHHLGVVLAYSHVKGLKFGADFDNIDDMPSMERGAVVTGVQTEYDENMIPFPGKWTTDARVCLQSQAPRPCTVLGMSIDLMMYS